MTKKLGSNLIYCLKKNTIKIQNVDEKSLKNKGKHLGNIREIGVPQGPIVGPLFISCTKMNIF